MKILSDEEIKKCGFCDRVAIDFARAIEAAVIKKLKSVDAIHEWYFEEEPIDEDQPNG